MAHGGLGGCCDTLPWRGGVAIPVRENPCDELRGTGHPTRCIERVLQHVLRSQRGRVELEHRQWLILSCYRRTACALSPDRALGGSGAWYAMELTELLPHVARELNINWEEATRYAGLNAES